MAYEITPEKESELFGKDPIMPTTEAMWLESAIYWTGRVIEHKWGQGDLRFGVDGSPESKSFTDLLTLLRESDDKRAKALVAKYDKGGERARSL